jgi:multidrug efflux pump subunit AcrA (membrane-fusion protein)
VVLIVDGNNKIQRRDVKLGLQNATYAEVLSGLQEGDMVILGEPSQYKTGEAVTPQVATTQEIE